MIGKVTATTALILVELDTATELTMYVSLVDPSIPKGRVVSTVTNLCPSRRPTTISVTNLLPSESYIVTFSGVSRQCAEKRIGSFNTLDIADRTLRIITVSQDNPSAVLSGEHNVWATLAARILRKTLPPVDLVLHTGGQVDMSTAFGEAWVLLSRSAARTDLMPGEWSTIEAAAAERLRAAYRFSWNLPYTREVLASTSHLMVCADADVYPNFTLDVSLSPAVGGRVVAALLRVARGVYREYQRALWDGEDLERVS